MRYFHFSATCHWLRSKSHEKSYFDFHRGLAPVAGRTCLSVFSASSKTLQKIVQMHVFLHGLGFAAWSVCACDSSGIVSFHLFCPSPLPCAGRFSVIFFPFFLHNVLFRRSSRIQLVYLNSWMVLNKRNSIVLFWFVFICLEKSLVSLTGWKPCRVFAEPGPELNQTWWQQPQIYIWPWMVV